MKKVNEIQARKTGTETEKKEINLWNSIEGMAINTCDFIAKCEGYVSFNYGIVGSFIIEFKDKVKPSSVLGNDTTVEEIESINESDFDDYGILSVTQTFIPFQDLKKPNGWGIYKNNDGMLLVMTNGSTFKRFIIEGIVKA